MEQHCTVGAWTRDVGAHEQVAKRIEILKDRHVVAFGGDGLYTAPAQSLSAKFICSLTGEARPKVCFLPTATGDSLEYIEQFYRVYATELCEPHHLPLFNREVVSIRDFILSMDAIYVGGGNTANMLAIWRVHGVDVALKEAYERGTVMCGTSAGSLCWFECGVTDSFGRDLSPLPDGLGFIGGSNCPHYSGEPLREPQYRKFVAEGLLPAGYAADDGTALHFVNGQFVEALGSKEGTRAFRVEMRDGVLEQTAIPVRYLGVG